MQQPVHERFLDAPRETLDLIVFGGLPENGLYPEDITVAERLERYFGKAPPVTRRILERVIFEWLDALTRERPTKPRDYVATKLEELFLASVDLRMGELADLMAPNAQPWGRWLREYSHLPKPDPFCRILSPFGKPGHRPGTFTTILD